MNNKGFTLVEMLAVVVLLGLVSGISFYGVVGVINNSKKKSEELFVDKLEKTLQSYINDNRFRGLEISGDAGSFEKCRRVNDDGTCYDDEGIVVDFFGPTTINLSVLEDEKYINNGKIINPKNKLECLNGKDPEVILYKDSDSVYYYYIDLRGELTSCDVSQENAIVTNISKNMCDSLGWNYSEEVCIKS